ncbi:hypothetical protein ABZ154_14700 [Streptomyces sp. NPDC006261]|uniref:hypothetical protein n=1 Tax=Streptomyces sp. NPDC006261 TaxID=3156739 RepID=UPI0033A31BB6
MMWARGADGRAVRRVAVALSVAALLGAGACGPSDQAEPSSESPSVTGPGSATAEKSSAAEAAKSVLEKGIVNIESLGEGDGVLQRQFGNTLASVPEDVLSVSFAFTCTGGAKVALAFRLAGKEVASAAGTHVCDGATIFQRSIGTAESGPLGFSAVATGAESGGYAYAYHSEKKQLP